MATRPAAHGKDEKAIFEAFLVAHVPFAAKVKEVHQPDDQFPDIVATMTDGTEVDFELGEWLDGAQVGEAKRYERLQKTMLDAIAPPGPNPSPHFRAVMLTAREDATRFDPADRAAFRSEFLALVAETHHFWPTEPFWHSPQGRICQDFAEHPTLGMYLVSALFDPLVVRGAPRPWPAREPWVFVEGRGGAYSEETALRAMADILDQKIGHYGRFSRPTRLIIYYGKAVACNTPYVGIQTRDFADAAARAAAVVAGQTAFEKIYLLNALEPGLEAFEIYPTCVRCA